MMIHFQSNVLEFKGKRFELPHSILDAEEIGDNAFIVYDYMEFNSNSVANNMCSIDQVGEVVWVAENATNHTNDAYTHILREETKGNTIAVNNFAGYFALIDILSGKLIKSEFRL